MNPEFRRNIWLELAPRRFATMTTILLLVFFAAALTGNETLPPAIAALLYYFIVVFWGSRNAALSVVGEIRDRTWDFQRLSALGAGEMMWGKLFGSTIFNWYGGALCLLVIVTDRLAHAGSLAALIDLVYFVVLGLISQSVALLASLVAALRRQAHTRLEIFTYQAAGLLAALAAFNVWKIADPNAALLGYATSARAVPWWGQYFNARTFLLLSLAVFAAWTLIGCYRAMRIELKMRNGPFLWLVFLAFIGVYVAGFDAWLPTSVTANAQDEIALRLALAASTFGMITYIMVLLEPKDRVLYRWLGAAISKGRIGSAFAKSQGWMMSYLAALAVSTTLIGWFAHEQLVQAMALVGSAFGFLTRDVAIFVLLQTFPGRRRGDFAAIITLFALYALAPAIAHGLALREALVLFYPQNLQHLWLSPVVAWTEALAVATLAIRRLAAGVSYIAAAA